MNKIFKIIIMASAFFSFMSVPSSVGAQNYYGGYVSKNASKRPDEMARPIPKIFSSQVNNAKQVEKLDALYDNLYVSLWMYAETDFIFQKKLNKQMEPKRFQLTRHEKEFDRDLKGAMKNLNENFSAMMDEIKNAEIKYEEIKESLKRTHRAILDPLWHEKIETFRSEAESYFKMQHAFLNTYRNLVVFILKQGGGYYYKTNEQKVYFYKFGGYKFYGQAIDKLAKISFNQRNLLRDNAPANTNVEFK